VKLQYREDIEMIIAILDSIDVIMLLLSKKPLQREVPKIWRMLIYEVGQK